MELNRLKNTAVVVAIALLQWGCVALSPAKSPPRVVQGAHHAPQRILFVGNSYLYYNDSLHNHVRRIAEELGPHAAGNYQYKSATIGGAALSHHNLDTLLEPGRLGLDQPFELVILQGGSGETLTPARRAVFHDKAVELSTKIRASGARVALYMTHAYVKPHAKFDPAMIDTISRTYVTTANDIDALVLPIGLAFERAYELRPALALHKPFDGSHPSLLGTYLGACVVYGSIYKAPVSGMDYDYFGKVSKRDAQFLQRVADETVSAFFARSQDVP